MYIFSFTVTLPLQSKCEWAFNLKDHWNTIVHSTHKSQRIQSSLIRLENIQKCQLNDCHRWTLSAYRSDPLNSYYTESLRLQETTTINSLYIFFKKENAKEPKTTTTIIKLKRETEYGQQKPSCSSTCSSIIYGLRFRHTDTHHSPIQTILFSFCIGQTSRI